jgi:hypothetical protein
MELIVADRGILSAQIEATSLEADWICIYVVASERDVVGEFT